LAEKAGVEIPDDQEAVSSPSKQIKDEIYKINELAAQFFTIHF